MTGSDKDREPATGPGGTRDESGYSVRASHFWFGILALIVIVFGGIWLAIPGAETMHRLTSPSGNIVLDVGEICGDTSCGQIIVLDFPAPDGERYRNPCTTDLSEDRPVFVAVSAEWAADENSVTLTYADAEGVGSTITLDLAVDCAVS